MKKKRILSLILTGVMSLSLFSFSGCKKETVEPLKPMIYHSIPVKYDNETARCSIADTAVRYFYLVNNGKYAEANELIDRTDLSICTPEILEEMYSNVLNFELNGDNRIVSVDVSGNRASLTFISLNDTEKSFDPVYTDENPAPSWYKSTTPYITEPDYATTYAIQDVNDDGYIDETDMQWEDHPELNPDYEPDDYDEDDYDTTATGANTVTKTTASSAKSDTTKSVDDMSKVVSKEESSVESGKLKDLNDIGVSSKHVDSEISEGVSETKGAVSEIANESVVEDEPIVKSDILPDELHESEEIIGYKTYMMDIYVTPYTSGFKVKLPASMTTNKRLMIKVPDDMKIKVGDLELNKSMMNLDDFYVIDKLPKVEKFTVELENLMLGHSEKEIDLTKRVYYIYSNLVPTHDLKEQVISYIKPALQQYYNDLFSGVKFENSAFLRDYVYKGDELADIKFRYDKFQLDNMQGYDADDRTKISYSVRRLRFPLNTEDSDDELNTNNFRVTSYYYVEVPVYVTIDVTTVDSSNRKELESIEIGGIVKITKNDDKLYIWDLDDALSLLDY